MTVPDALQAWVEAVIATDESDVTVQRLHERLCAGGAICAGDRDVLMDTHGEQDVRSLYLTQAPPDGVPRQDHIDDEAVHVALYDIADELCFELESLTPPIVPYGLRRAMGVSAASGGGGAGGGGGVGGVAGGGGGGGGRGVRARNRFELQAALPAWLRQFRAHCGY